MASTRQSGKLGASVFHSFSSSFTPVYPFTWHTAFAFRATNVGHRSDKQGQAVSAEKISTLQVVFRPTVFGRTLRIVILGTSFFVA
jgi:hypothetical protein